MLGGFVKETLVRLIGEGDALLITPPFGGIDRPSLGLHILQACAKLRKLNVRVLYANLALASEMGEANYSFFSIAMHHMLGERFFARAAFGTAPFGNGPAYLEEAIASTCLHQAQHVDKDRIIALESELDQWLDHLASIIAECGFKVVGCSTTFEQTGASVALLSRVKEIRPDIITIVGGANCEGPMAEGIQSLSSNIDYVFSGRAEDSFSTFLEGIQLGAQPQGRIVHPGTEIEIEDIPPPDYSHFYEQLEFFLPNGSALKNGAVWLPYETSRGCYCIPLPTSQRGQSRLVLDTGSRIC